VCARSKPLLLNSILPYTHVYAHVIRIYIYIERERERERERGGGVRVEHAIAAQEHTVKRPANDRDNSHFLLPSAHAARRRICFRGFRRRAAHVDALRRMRLRCIHSSLKASCTSSLRPHTLVAEGLIQALRRMRLRCCLCVSICTLVPKQYFVRWYQSTNNALVKQVDEE
jgi:hypothetical protein